MTPEGIAEKAGMLEGDVILKVNDTSLQEAMTHNEACKVTSFFRIVVPCIPYSLYLAPQALLKLEFDFCLSILRPPSDISQAYLQQFYFKKNENLHITCPIIKIQKKI